MSLKDKLTELANGFRSSRNISGKLTLDKMAELAAEKTTVDMSMKECTFVPSLNSGDCVNNICYFKKMLILTTNYTLYYSTDGKNWIRSFQTYHFEGDGYITIIKNDNILAITALKGIYYSEDGINWSAALENETNDALGLIKSCNFLSNNNKNIFCYEIRNSDKRLLYKSNDIKTWELIDTQTFILEGTALIQDEILLFLKDDNQMYIAKINKNNDFEIIFQFQKNYYIRFYDKNNIFFTIGNDLYVCLDGKSITNCNVSIYNYTSIKYISGIFYFFKEGTFFYSENGIVWNEITTDFIEIDELNYFSGRWFLIGRNEEYGSVRGNILMSNNLNEWEEFKLLDTPNTDLYFHYITFIEEKIFSVIIEKNTATIKNFLFYSLKTNEITYIDIPEKRLLDSLTFNIFYTKDNKYHLYGYGNYYVSNNAITWNKENLPKDYYRIDDIYEFNIGNDIIFYKYAYNDWMYFNLYYSTIWEP